MQLGRMGVAIAVLVLLALASFAIPIPTWRTGELPAPPLPLVEGGPAVSLPERVWIDTDAACGHSRTTDPDDCLAILLLANAKRVEIVGVSSVHGNGPVEVTDRVTRSLAAILKRDGLTAPPVYRGSAVPMEENGALTAEPAHAALRAALRDGRLTVVSLGPLTNVAAALKDRPDLQANIGRLVVVMGRRRGHLFHPAEGAGKGMLFGHGPVFRDFNFDKDRLATTSVLGMRLPMTLIPYEAARQVSLTGVDLTRLEARGGAAAWVALRAQGWLDFWNQEVGRAGFYPFDLLAAAYVLSPEHFDCAEAKAWIGKDPRLWGWLGHPWGLLVGLDWERPADVRASSTVVYCPQVDSALHRWLMSRLVSQAPSRLASSP